MDISPTRAETRNQGPSPRRTRTKRAPVSAAGLLPGPPPKGKPAGERSGGLRGLVERLSRACDELDREIVQQERTLKKEIARLVWQRDRLRAIRAESGLSPAAWPPRPRQTGPKRHGTDTRRESPPPPLVSLNPPAEGKGDKKKRKKKKEKRKSGGSALANPPVGPPGGEQRRAPPGSSNPR